MRRLAGGLLRQMAEGAPSFTLASGRGADSRLIFRGQWRDARRAHAPHFKPA